MQASEFKVRMVRPRPGIFEAVLITEENKEAVKQWVSRDCGNAYPLFGLGDWVIRKREKMLCWAREGQDMTVPFCGVSL